jgi:hypothetical protein
MFGFQERAVRAGQGFAQAQESSAAFIRRRNGTPGQGRSRVRIRTFFLIGAMSLKTGFI